MKLKCVGGPHDGEMHDIHEGDRDIMLARDTLPPISVLSPFEASSELFTVEQSHYTRRYICGTIETSKRERAALVGHYVPYRIIEFLAPVDWTDEQAIRHQFHK